MVGLVTSSVRPKKSKSIDMRLDWLKERDSQQFFRLVFLPGLINPADFFTKILPIYRHIAALPFLHGTPYPISFPPTPFPSHHIPTLAPGATMQFTTGTLLNLTAFCFTPLVSHVCAHRV